MLVLDNNVHKQTVWYSGLDSSQRNTWQTEYDKKYTNGPVV